MADYSHLEGIRKRFRAARGAKRMSQSDVADAVSLSTQAISKFERGQMAIKEDCLVKISILLDAPLRLGLDITPRALARWAYMHDFVALVHGSSAAPVISKRRQKKRLSGYKYLSLDPYKVAETYHSNPLSLFEHVIKQLGLGSLVSRRQDEDGFRELIIANRSWL